MRKLKSIYIPALIVIALVIIVSQYLLQKSISTTAYDSHTINLSGRQSMLSQKIAKAALAMKTSDTESEFVRHQVELKEASMLWETSHNALQYGNEDLKLDNVNNSQETFSLFLELEPHYESIKRAVGSLLRISFSAESRADLLREFANNIIENEADYLRLMSEITLAYDNESTQRLKEISQTEYILLGVALVLLLLEALFVFKPAIKKINDFTKKIIEKDKSLKEALEAQMVEQAKVEYLNKQAKMVFENVKQGIFLMDKDFKISELYSKAMEEIFEEEKIAKANFMKLMSPRLVKRDQSALEMFGKHLFNPDIDEEVLNQLNPVEEVEIFSIKKNKTINSRHLIISFSRIIYENKIASVLINVKDQSETVLMQKKIAETEEKNKRESEQLLSILNVDADQLSDFLIQTKQSINDISEEYEKNKVKDFKNLINYTCEVIHKLKGNAMFIDIQLLVDKFHNIENTISHLKEKDTIIANDFLTILYELNEINSIIENMQKMFLKMSRVNTNLLENIEESSTNSKLKFELKKGLEILSRQKGKRVILDFNDNGHIITKNHRDILKNIIVQLFRNSLAHGIETKEERENARKPLLSIIQINIEKMLHDTILISYQDDGKGLELDKIVQSAIENKICTKEAISKMTTREQVELIFSHGLSTSDSVDTLTGRGQGLSLVKSIIKSNRGKYALSSKKGKYFRLTFTLSKPKVLQPQIEVA